MSRPTKTETLSRARSPEDKAKVREAFIAAGRRLYAQANPEAVSLRRIAAEAGYAPGAIYKYFVDQHDLFFHIRAHDMEASTEQLRHLIARIRSPAKRVHKLFLGTADYWLQNMEAFLVMFPAPSAHRALAIDSAGVPFGRSAVVQASLRLYYETVDEFFRTLERPPMSSHLACDILLAAVHGVIVFPCMTRSMEWSDTRLMVERLVAGLVAEWSANGGTKRIHPVGR